MLKYEEDAKACRIFALQALVVCEKSGNSSVFRQALILISPAVNRPALICALAGAL